MTLSYEKLIVINKLKYSPQYQRQQLYYFLPHLQKVKNSSGMPCLGMAELYLDFPLEMPLQESNSNFFFVVVQFES